MFNFGEMRANDKIACNLIRPKRSKYA